MTAPNIPDPNDPSLTPPPNPNPNPNTETQPSSDNLSVDTTGRELFFATLREKENRIRELQQRLEAKEATPRVTGDAAWQEMTSDPRKVIQEEVAAAVKPLNEFVSMFARREAFQGLKIQAAQMEVTNRLVLEKAGLAVDQVLAKAEPTLDNVLGAIQLVAGLIATGKVNGVTIADITPGRTTQPNNNMPNRQPPREVPPSIAPSAHPITNQPDKDVEKPWENLAETEKAMARYYGMSYEEYWKQMQGDQISVSTTRKGKNAPNNQPLQTRNG